MAAINDRIACLLPLVGPNFGLERLRSALRAVARYGSAEELAELGTALLEQPLAEGVALGLETLARAQPGRATRPDEDLETLSQRARQLGMVCVCGRVLGQASSLVPTKLHGDLLVLCALAGGSSGLGCLLGHLRANDRWAGLSARLMLLRALKLEQRETGDRVHLEAALADALEAWPEHERREVLLATTLLASGSRGRLARALRRPDLPAMVALRRLVREAREELVRTRLVRLISFRPLARAATEALEDVRTAQFDLALSTGGHLLRTPKRKRRVARSRVGSKLAGRLRRRQPASPEAARSMPMLLTGCLRNPDRLVRRLTLLAAHPDELTSVLATAELLRSKPSEGQEKSLAELGSGRPAKTSTQRLAQAGASHTAATDAFYSLSAFEKALSNEPSWLCASSALGHLAERADALMSVLRRALLSGRAKEIDNVLEVIARRRLVGQFEQDLITWVESSAAPRQPELAGRALRLLAQGATGRSARSIVRALASPYPQLQAAGLEAATDVTATPAVQAGCALVDTALLERLARASDSRVRAGALRALRARSQGLCTRVLHDLLADDSPEYRLSGLEAARATNDPSIRASVLRLMEHEGEQEFITRGRAVLRFLEARRGVSSTQLQEVPG